MLDRIIGTGDSRLCPLMCRKPPLVVLHDMHEFMEEKPVPRRCARRELPSPEVDVRPHRQRPCSEQPSRLYRHPIGMDAHVREVVPEQTIHPREYLLWQRLASTLAQRPQHRMILAELRFSLGTAQHLGLRRGALIPASEQHPCPQPPSMAKPARLQRQRRRRPPPILMPLLEPPLIHASLPRGVEQEVFLSAASSMAR